MHARHPPVKPSGISRCTNSDGTWWNAVRTGMWIRLDRTLSCILIEKCIHPFSIPAAGLHGAKILVSWWWDEIRFKKKKNAIQSACATMKSSCCLIPFQFAWADVWVCCLKDYTHQWEFVPQNSAWLPRCRSTGCIHNPLRARRSAVFTVPMTAAVQ